MPVEWFVRQLERVLVEEFLFDGQQFGSDERDDGPLDRTPVGEGRRRLVAVRSNEFLFAPREDGGRVHLAGIAIDLDTLTPADALGCHLGELLVQLLWRTRLAAKPAAADGAAA